MRMRVLIADDDALSRHLLATTLERLGYTLTIATDGAEALALCQAAGGPRLAILDWMMPGLDGLAVCRALRQHSEAYVYVLLLTGRTGREDLLEAFDAEIDDFLTKPFDPDELRARLRAAERVLRLQEQLLQVHDALRHEATHDHLTGVWNRRSILERLRGEWSRARRTAAPLSVALCDLDCFKSINDTHGHAVGDVVLKESAWGMASALRDYDSIGRYGGEEFLVVLPGCDATDALTVAERVRRAVELRHAAGDCCRASVSVGVATVRSELDTVEALVQRADEALYRAKREGRNRVAA
jgi:diguanylate cyclase (GGDEF)-like protein